MPRSVGAGSSATASPAASKKAWLKTGIDPMLADALEELTELLVSELVKILPCLRDAKSEKYLFKSDAPATNDADDIPFHKTYKKLYRAPKDFPRAYLLQLSMDNGRRDLDDELLQAAEKASEGATREAFFYLHDVAPETTWPTFCHDRRIFKATFAQQHKNLGARIKHLVYNRMGNKVQYDETSSGQYRLLPIEGYPKTHIEYKHLSLKAELQDFALIASEFSISANYSHMKATLKYKRASALCIDFFSDDAKAKIADHFRAAAKQLQNIANEKEQARPIDDNEIEAEAGASSSTVGAGAKRPAPPPRSFRRLRQKTT